jgi:glycerol kinase
VASKLLAIDQGTTSTRSIVFDSNLTPIATSQQEFTQIFPAPGWVEHDPEEIWRTVLSTVKEAIAKAGAIVKDIAGIGITNQRETVVIWDRATGKTIHNAIVWQDRRTADQCATLKQAGHESEISARTGLLLDPYFSATKIAWLLDHVDGARAAAEAGRLAFGTIDCFLLWRLTDVRDCAGRFGVTMSELFGGSIAILGIAGDQQAATVGQGCFQPGMLKSTYGTGCFAVLNTGDERVVSHNRLLTTIAYQLEGRRTYALEGTVFIAGAAVQWLRDAMKVIPSADAADAQAALADPAEEVYLVPAFVGLGAPWWDAHARGAIYGLTRKSGVPELVRATLESIGHQTCDLMEAMREDMPDLAEKEMVLRVDGGMTASDFTMQFLADILQAPVDRPVVMETTAHGAAYLAGRAAGICPDLAEYAATWQRDRRFNPQMDEATRTRKRKGWKRAVRNTLTAHDDP